MIKYDTKQALLQALGYDLNIKRAEVSSKVLSQQVWVASWGFYGCLSESVLVCETKKEAIEAACSFAETEDGIPRGMKTELKRFGLWEGPAYGSSSNVQVTKIEKVAIGDLL